MSIEQEYIIHQVGYLQSKRITPRKKQSLNLGCLFPFSFGGEETFSVNLSRMEWHIQRIGRGGNSTLFQVHRIADESKVLQAYGNKSAVFRLLPHCLRRFIRKNLGPSAPILAFFCNGHLEKCHSLLGLFLHASLPSAKKAPISQRGFTPLDSLKTGYRQCGSIQRLMPKIVR